MRYLFIILFINLLNFCYSQVKFNPRNHLKGIKLEILKNVEVWVENNDSLDFNEYRLIRVFHSTEEGGYEIAKELEQSSSVDSLITVYKDVYFYTAHIKPKNKKSGYSDLFFHITLTGKVFGVEFHLEGKEDELWLKLNAIEKKWYKVDKAEMSPR